MLPEYLWNIYICMHIALIITKDKCRDKHFIQL